MVYPYFAGCCRATAHWFVDHTFPGTASIATISAGAGWYSHAYGETYLPGIIAKFYEFGGGKITVIVGRIFGYGNVEKGWWDWAGETAGHFTAPVYNRQTMKTILPWVSVGASCATSLSLNLIAKYVFKIKLTNDPAKRVHPMQVVKPDRIQKTKTPAGILQLPQKMEVKGPVGDNKRKGTEPLTRKEVAVAMNKPAAAHTTIAKEKIQEKEADDRVFSTECLMNFCS